ncbi:MAG: NAD(P)/FAD-dependent oxidoreductase, partial [Myxococcota bacterium]
MNHVADKFDLRRSIKLETKLETAKWDDDAQRWTVKTDTGETYRPRFLIMATGCLSTPKDIDIQGASSFQGQTYHTANWPHEKVSFEGKRVGVIGTGSSAIQAIPEIAREARHLTVFQRTPNFSFPTFNRPLTDAERAEAKTNYLRDRDAARAAGFGIPTPDPLPSALLATPEERDALYESRWQEGRIVAVLTAYGDLVLSKEANDTAADFVRRKIREKVKDPKVAEDLIPTDHPVGAKRPCMDTNYFETFNESHVDLVNLRRTPILEITPKGVRTAEGEVELDALVFATGFDALTGTLVRLDIEGRQGQTLKDKWADGPVSYLGLTVAGFPNFFTLTGPSSPSVLSNMMVSIEQHVDWVADCLSHLKDQGVSAIEPTLEAEEEWRAHVEATGNRTVYPLADSWYMGANVPGKPRVFLAYIGGVNTYRTVCDTIAAFGYDGFRL